MNAVGADPVDDALLEKLQRWVFECFLQAYNPRNRLVSDTLRASAPARIAVIGFLNYGREGDSEAILLYLLGLGSPTPAFTDESFTAWTMTYQWENLVGYDFLYVGPLFIHQFLHARTSLRVIYVQREYAMRNPCSLYERRLRTKKAEHAPNLAQPPVPRFPCTRNIGHRSAGANRTVLGSPHLPASSWSAVCQGSLYL